MMHKGKINAPRKAKKLTGANDFDQNWNLIKDALVDIHDQNAGRLSFEQLYRASYNIVLLKRGEDLYQRVRAFEERHFAENVIPHIWMLVTRKLVAVTFHNVPGSTANERRALAEVFLRGIKDSWERHNISMNMVADVLMYLDRGYAQDATRPFIYATTIGLFRDHILRAPLPPSAWSDADQFAAAVRGSREAAGAGAGVGAGAGGNVGAGSSTAGAGDGGNPGIHPTVFTVLNSVIFDLINMDRDGDVIDRNLARGCVAMLEALYESDDELEDEKLYLTTFEPEFMHATYLFYRAECERLLREGDARAWLRQTRRRLREEQERCGHTISQLSRTKVARVVERELVAAHLEDFLALEGSGIKAMIDNDRVEDLAILYDLVCRVESKKSVLKQALQTRIVDLGLEIEKALKETDFSAAPAPAPSTAATAAAAVDREGATKAAALSAAAQQTAAAIKWVTDILELKEKFDRLWLECFNKDIVLQSVMTSSFTELFRLCTRSAEYVSLFIDDCFKRGLRGKSDAEIDNALDKATVMIQHVTEKDMLERYYQKHLARRLLHNKSENPEAEKMLISRMQSELGKTFTAKFEGMFKDMATSEELTRDYGKYAKENLDDDGEPDQGPGPGPGPNRTRIDLSVSVLTSNNWPPEVMGRASQLEESLGGGSGGSGGGSSGSGGGSSGCIYPAEVQRLQASFLKFYLRNRSGRVLSWVGSAGSADMRCVFPRVAGVDKGVLSRERRYELSVPTYGMVVLLLFNGLAGEQQQLSFEEIQAKTNIPAADLTRALASLTIPPKCRVLTKEPPSKTIRPGDRFGFNAQFASKTLKIKVPVINALSKVEGEDERKATEDKNNQTRSHTVDAAVVRIMKQRKELMHTALITEVVTQLASLFRPEVAMVKKRIEDLISREYLERIEESDPPAYRYVA